MEHQSVGYCRFCLKIFSGAGMGRHLAACKMRKEKNELELKEGRKKYKIYHRKLAAVNGTGCTLKFRQKPPLSIWTNFYVASGWSVAAI